MKQIFLSTKTTGLTTNSQIYELCAINSDGEILHHTWRPPFVDRMTKADAIKGGYFSDASKVTWEHLKSLDGFDNSFVTEFQNFVQNGMVYHYAFIAHFARLIAPVRVQTVDMHEVCKFKYSNLQNFKFETILQHLGKEIGDRTAPADAAKLYEIYQSIS